MKARKLGTWCLLSAVLALSLLVVGGDAFAQDADPTQFLAKTKETAKHGWGLLNTLGSVVIGGGALISLAAGMYQGRWGQAAISFVAGAAGLMALWGIGEVLGL